MVDKKQAHELTAQILSSYIQCGKFAFPDQERGSDVGKFLGSAYQALFTLITNAEPAEVELSQLSPAELADRAEEIARNAREAAGR